MDVILKDVKHVELNKKIVSVFLDNLTKIQMFICCNKNYHKKNLQKNFFNTYIFSNYGINKFILLLQKAVSYYEYMDYFKKFNETS